MPSHLQSPSSAAQRFALDGDTIFVGTQTTGTVAVTGGVQGPMWLLYVTGLLFAGMSIPATVSILFGFLTSLCLGLTAFITHDLDESVLLTTITTIGHTLDIAPNGEIIMGQAHATTIHVCDAHSSEH